MVDNQTALCYNYYISKETNNQLRKRYKMKNVILASVVASIAASSAFANKGPLPVTNPNPATTVSSVSLEASAEVKWEGKVTGLEDGCLFTKNENGKMSYTENALAGGVWTVTEKALLEVSVRGRNTSLSIEADSAVVRVGGEADDFTSNGHDMYDVTVDYAGGNMPSTLSRSYRVDSDRDNIGQQDMTSDVAYSAGKIDIMQWNVGKHNKIELGGTATMNYSGALIDNGDYELRHTATCLQ